MERRCWRGGPNFSMFICVCMKRPRQKRNKKLRSYPGRARHFYRHTMIRDCCGLGCLSRKRISENQNMKRPRHWVGNVRCIRKRDTKQKKKAPKRKRKMKWNKIKRCRLGHKQARTACIKSSRLRSECDSSLSYSLALIFSFDFILSNSFRVSMSCSLFFFFFSSFYFCTTCALFLHVGRKKRKRKRLVFSSFKTIDDDSQIQFFKTQFVFLL